MRLFIKRVKLKLTSDPNQVVDLIYDWDLHNLAVKKLIKMGKAARPAIPRLLQIIERGSFADQQIRAARVLGEVGDITVCPALVKLWFYGDAGRRKAAYEALRKIAAWHPVTIDEQIVDTFEKNDADRLIVIGEPAVEPLIKIWKIGGKYNKVDREASRFALGVLSKMGGSAVPGLIKAVDDSLASRRDSRDFLTESIEVMGQILDSRTIPILLEVARRSMVVSAAMDLLVRMIKKQVICDPEKVVIPELIKILESTDVSRRIAAANALGEIGDMRARRALLAATADEAQRVPAVIALGRLDGLQAGTDLLDMMERYPSWNLEMAVINQLGVNKEKRAVSVLLDRLRDTSLRHDMRQEVALALEKMEWSPETKEDSVHFYLGKKDWEALSELGTVAIPALCAAFRHEGTEERYGFAPEIAAVLGKIGKEAVPALLDLLLELFEPVYETYNSKEGLRSYLIRQLRIIEDSRSVGVLEQIFEKLEMYIERKGSFFYMLLDEYNQIGEILHLFGSPKGAWIYTYEHEEGRCGDIYVRNIKKVKRDRLNLIPS